MSQTRQATSNPAFASTRITSQTTSDSSHSHSSGLLRLRGEDTRNADEGIASARHIKWSEDVIDNEGKGKKSSKVCCIYHKSHPVGESSSESDSSDSDSDDSSDSDNETDWQGNRGGLHLTRPHNMASRPGEQDLETGRCSYRQRPNEEKARRKKPSPNAYEKMPKATKRSIGTPGR